MPERSEREWLEGNEDEERERAARRASEIDAIFERPPVEITPGQEALFDTSDEG